MKESVSMRDHYIVEMIKTLMEEIRDLQDRVLWIEEHIKYMQLKKVAEKCDVDISHTEPGKGGFIFDSSGVIHDTMSDVVMESINKTCESEKNK